MLEPITLHELENFLGALAGVAEPSKIIIEEIPLEKVKHCNHCNNCKTAPKQQTEALSPVKNVIFDAPYTTVIWKDGTRTISKWHGEGFNKYAGFTACIAKKYLGTSLFKQELSRWCKDTKKDMNKDASGFSEYLKAIDIR